MLQPITYRARLVLVAFLVLTVGISGISTTAAPAPTTFVGLLRSHPQNLDPAIGTDNPHMKFFIAAYESLINYKPGTLGAKSLEGVLAKSWTVSQDGTTFTFVLRDNVKFHDGNTLTAEDVKVSFDRMKQINRGSAWALGDVKEVQATSPQTVRIILNKPSAAFLQSVPLVYIVSAKAVKENERQGDLGQDWLRNREAGTGPYMLESWRRDQELVMTRFNEYWRGWRGRKFERLVLRVVADQITQRQIIESGQADWADSITPEDAIQLEKSDRVSVTWNPSNLLLWLMMDTTRPPFNDVRVRRAMRLAFNYRGMVQRVLQGKGTIPQGYLLPFFPEHDPKIGPEQRDMARAKKLLVEAGYGSGKPLSFTIMYLGVLDWERQAAEMFAADLRALGITARLDGKPFATMTATAMTPQRPEMMYFAANPASGDPDSTFSQTWLSRSTHWSRYGYSNPRLDQIVEAARIEFNLEKRTAMYRQAQQILEQDSPAINTVILDWNHVFNNRVGGFTNLPLWPAILDFYQLTLK